jgi:hypothetical protein
MTLFYSHQDRFRDASGASLLRALALGIAGRTAAAFRFIHRAIVNAKMHRMQRELMFRDRWPVEPDARAGRNPDSDAAKFPQAPLILGDKWDF